MATSSLAPTRAWKSIPFAAALRRRLKSALPPGRPGAGELCQLDAELGEAYADAFAAAARRLAADRPGLAVLHGETVFHWVEEAGRARGTLQPRRTGPHPPPDPINELASGPVGGRPAFLPRGSSGPSTAHGASVRSAGVG